MPASLNPASDALAYLWDDAENYWPAAKGDDDLTDPFAPGLGRDLFEAAHARLDALGVCAPAIRFVDRNGTHCPADLEELLARDPSAAGPVMARLGEALEAMRRHRASTYGKVAVVDGGGMSLRTSCEGIVLDRALRDLAEAASRDPRIAGARDRLEEQLLGLAAALRPRPEYAVVHGELGPDHVLVDAGGNPVAIGIEGLMYFNVEWEHVFLRIRLHDAYRPLEMDGLDEDRLALLLELVADDEEEHRRQPVRGPRLHRQIDDAPHADGSGLRAESRAHLLEVRRRATV